MTAKQYLQDYRRLEGKYRAAVEEYKNVESEMVSLKSPNLDGDRVQTSAKSDPIGEIVVNLEDEKAKIGMRMMKFNAQMIVVRQQISQMEAIDNDYYVILLLRYVLYKDWKFVCDKLNLSRAQANVVHGRALQEFDKAFNQIYCDR
jgi:hypothetical protein